METIYKVVDQDGYTRREKANETKWQLGVKVTVTVLGNKLCTDQVIHGYRHPLLAALLNPIHANISNPRLLEGTSPEIVADDGLKVGLKSYIPRHEAKLPIITTAQQVRWAILVALELTPEWNNKDRFRIWADGWLSGCDRSSKVAEAARAAAAARAVAEAAWAARAAEVAWAVAEAARAVAEAARAAATVVSPFDALAFTKQLVALAERAILEEV